MNNSGAHNRNLDMPSMEEHCLSEEMSMKDKSVPQGNTATEALWSSHRYPINRGEVGSFFLSGDTLAVFCMYAVCQCPLHSLLFCLNVNDRSSRGFSVLIWQLVHGTTLINAIYQPFRSFLLDEGSVILIAKECIDIKTRTPTLAF